MPRYTVAHRYTSQRDGQTFGPWEPGDEVELEQADAEWVNRDSPGALALPAPPAKAAPRQAAPAPDRQHRGSKNRGT